MELYLCEYDDLCNNRDMYYFASGRNFRDIKIHKFTYNGNYDTNDDGNVVFEFKLENDEYEYEETGEMTLEEMDEYIIKLINEGRITETLDSWNEFKKEWFGVSEDLGIIELFDAINDDDVDEVKRLLQNRQFNLEERDSLGDTPLLKACIGGNIEIITELINHGANVNVVNTRFPELKSPIYTAIEHKNIQLLELLVSSGGILPDTVDEAMNFEIASFLHEHNVKFDNSCLISSVIDDDCDVATVRILNDIGVDINYIDSFGNNALHCACKYNPNPEIIQTLINRGINTELVNNNGKKPIDLLQNDSDKDLCRKIINREINISTDEKD